MTEEFGEAVDPAEAFGALSDATRVGILQALWESDDRHVTFSELRDAVGMRDSGQFNYHLNKLREQFVRKTDDGYRLTLAGVHVVGSLLAGAVTGKGTVDPIPLDDPCPYCGGDRTFEYEDEEVSMTCEDCGLGMHFGVPPGVFAEYELDRIPAVAERYGRLLVHQASEGFCPHCEGRIDAAITVGVGTLEADADPPENLADIPTVEYHCRRCEEDLISDLGTALLDHPAVVAFYHDRGINIRDEPLSRFVATSAEKAAVTSEDPLRAEVTYEAEEDALTLVVDENVTVVGRG